MDNSDINTMKALESLIKKSKSKNPLITGYGGFVIKYKKHSKIISNIIKILNGGSIYFKYGLKFDDYNGIQIPVNETHNTDLEEYWKYKRDISTLYYR